MSLFKTTYSFRTVAIGVTLQQNDFFVLLERLKVLFLAFESHGLLLQGLDLRSNVRHLVFQII